MLSYYTISLLYSKTLSSVPKRLINYVQGQSPEPKIREYFYYIDHQGMLFLDDSRMKNFTSCFKEKKFLEFFFKRIRINTTGRYQEEFPYISLCGRERNFIKCDDVPIVYTHIITKEHNGVDAEFLSYGYAGELMSSLFLPGMLYMLPQTGRVYHPTLDIYGGIALVKSKLAIELSKHFDFHNGEAQPPTHFTWNNNKHKLDQNWFQEKLDKFQIKINTSGD